MKVQDALKKYAKNEEWPEKGPREIFVRLYNKEKMSLRRIGKLLKVSRPALAYWRDEWEIPARTSSNELTEKVEALGYGSLRDFFQENDRKSFEWMAGQLGVSAATVGNYYLSFAEDVKDEW